jgi:NADH-quinone oxidoreductase subunit A
LVGEWTYLSSTTGACLGNLRDIAGHLSRLGVHSEPVQPRPSTEVKSMPSEYLPIGVLVLVATFVAAAALFISYLGPRRPSARKSMPYESGIRPIRSARQRFPVRFYLVAMLFIVFDIEGVFFYPWAVAFRDLGVFGLVEMLTFIGLLLAGYFYILKRGGLDWE